MSMFDRSWLQNDSIDELPFETILIKLSSVMSNMWDQKYAKQL